MHLSRAVLFILLLSLAICLTSARNPDRMLQELELSTDLMENEEWTLEEELQLAESQNEHELDLEENHEEIIIEEPSKIF